MTDESNGESTKSDYDLVTTHFIIYPIFWFTVKRKQDYSGYGQPFTYHACM